MTSEFQFTPLEVLTWERKYEDGTTFVVGEYHPGMTYNCTKEPRHDALRKKCDEWEKKKKIKIIPLGNRRFLTITTTHIR